MLWIIKLGSLLFLALIAGPYIVQKIWPDLDKHNKFMTHVDEYGNAPPIDPNVILRQEPMSKDASRIRRRQQKKREQGKKATENVEA